MNERATRIALAAFVATEGAHAFSAFMPSAFTIRTFVQTEDDVDKLRSGYVPAVAFNVALGMAVSVLADDYLPLGFSVVVAAAMIGLYEYSIRKTREGE